MGNFSCQLIPFCQFRLLNAITIPLLFIFANLLSLVPICATLQSSSPLPDPQCFEQQYSNRVANFGSLHIVKRVGVVSFVCAL
jgi:hypothetical protein